MQCENKQEEEEKLEKQFSLNILRMKIFVD